MHPAFAQALHQSSPGSTQPAGRRSSPRQGLNDREQAVDAAQRLAGNRHPQHRQPRHAGDHAGQVRCATCACDDHLEACRHRAFGKFHHPVRRAVRRYDPAIMCHAQFDQDCSSTRHRFPIGLTAHDNRDRNGGNRDRLGLMGWLGHVFLSACWLVATGS
jgi:hypothetical protein